MPDKDGNTNYLGYYFVEMIRHFDGIQNASNEELLAMTRITKCLASALLQVLNGERIYTFILGDGVPHMHEHVVIKHSGTPNEYKGFKVDEWQGAPRGGHEDIMKLNNDIKVLMNICARDEHEIFDPMS